VVFMVAELAQNCAGQHTALANKVDVVDPVGVRSCCGSWEPVRWRGRRGPLLPLYDSRVARSREQRGGSRIVSEGSD
jgi:hypothetical protein